MRIASIPTRALLGIEAPPVSVEAHLSPGLPSFAIVGMPETSVKESKERVRCALLNAGFDFPAQRITVNLAPADLPKAGGRYDLAIAMAILVASEQMDSFGGALDGIELLGELALDGSLRPVPGVVQALLAAKSEGRAIIVPEANRSELEIVDYSLALAIAELADLMGVAASLATEGATPLAVFAKHQRPSRPPLQDVARTHFDPVRGQAQALRALQIAAAGGHNLLMIGPPGSGKTLLATTLSKLLPKMTRSETLEVAAIRSAAEGKLALGDSLTRPLRAPHHSATTPSLVGGGAAATPGDITLAHRGVLFLDELTEFKPSVLNALREPLEAGKITISRARYRVEYPANFQLVAAMNPCPCGYATDPRRRCRCTPDRVQSYLAKISGPLLDRFDLIIEVPALSHAELLDAQAGEAREARSARQAINEREATTPKQRKSATRPDEKSPELSKQDYDEGITLYDQSQAEWNERADAIEVCRTRQLKRQNALNCDIQSARLEHACGLNPAKKKELIALLTGLKVSARGAHRILRMARTVADYEGRAEVSDTDFQEAASYRRCHAMQALL